MSTPETRAMVKSFTLKGRAYIVVAAPGRLCKGCAFAGIPCPRIDHTTSTINTSATDKRFHGKDVVCVGHSMNHIVIEDTPEAKAEFFAERASNG